MPGLQGLVAAAKGAVESATDDRDSMGAGLAMPAHLSKKLDRRIKFVKQIKKSSIASLAARGSLQKPRKRRKKSQALNSLDTLTDALDTASAEVQQAAVRRHKLAGRGESKKRTKITSQETERLQQVLAHPQYQADPFTAIQSHLQATLPPAPLPKPAVKTKATGKSKKKVGAVR